MELRCVMIFSCVTLLLVSSTVQCRPINPLSSTFLENRKDESDEETNAVPASDDDNVKTDQATSMENIDSINVTNQPESTGIFRDPLEDLERSSEFIESGKDEPDEGTTNAVRTSDEGNAKTDWATSAKNFDSVSMANPPEGTGIFRDPLEILGPKFPDSVMINLCQVKLFVTADVISHIVFLDKGKYLCVQVCRQYQNTMEFDGPTTVSLMKGYCDYTGITDFSGVSAQDNQADMSTECTCAYRIRCNQKTNVIMYTFQASSTGFLKVSVTEPNQKYQIT